MNNMMHLRHLILSATLVGGLFSVCGCDSESGTDTEDFLGAGNGVFILNEGNFQAGNSTLTFYNPKDLTVQNGVFNRANGYKLGDTGQSITLYGTNAYIAVENSGIIWKIDVNTFKVEGEFKSSDTGGKMIDPRYIHFASSTKAYVTDLYSPYVNVFNPTTMEYVKSIPTGQPIVDKYASTEEMVQYDKYLFANCWSYSNKILIIDTEKDEVDGVIELPSMQPKSMKIDRNGKIWVITDGGYAGSEYGNDVPHLFKIDAATRTIEQDQALDADEANVQIAMNGTRDTLYLINNDVYRMAVSDKHLPVRPFIEAAVDKDSKRHKLYGLGVNPSNSEVYVSDAIDYQQAGVVYRYSSQGELIDKFYVGINPNGFAFRISYAY